jgi:MFS family permease
MTSVDRHQRDLSWRALAALNFAVYIVSMGIVVELPLLPLLIEESLPAGTSASIIAFHVALITAIYPFCIFLFSRLWTSLSKQYDPYWIIFIGLMGFATSLLLFSQAESLAARYLERVLSGLFAAAITPIAAGVIAHFSLSVKNGHRRLGFMSMMTTTGFLLGPLIGIAMIRVAGEFYSLATPFDAFSIRLIATSALAFLAAVIVWFGILDAGKYVKPQPSSKEVGRNGGTANRLLILTFMCAIAIGVLEIGIALFGRMHLSMNAVGVAILFAECTLVMVVTQAFVFSPWLKLHSTRWLIPLAMLMMSVSLLSTPWVTDISYVFWGLSSSAGLLSPVLSHWYSASATKEERGQGKQTAIFSLGLSLGIAVGAVPLISLGLFTEIFIILGLVTMLGFMLSLGLPRLQPDYEKPSLTTSTTFN